MSNDISGAGSSGEPLDTTEMRRQHAGDRVVDALCDLVDALRAEIDLVTRVAAGNLANTQAAEARLADWQKLARTYAERLAAVEKLARKGLVIDHGDGEREVHPLVNAQELLVLLSAGSGRPASGATTHPYEYRLPMRTRTTNSFGCTHGWGGPGYCGRAADDPIHQTTTPAEDGHACTVEAMNDPESDCWGPAGDPTHGGAE